MDIVVGKTITIVMPGGAVVRGEATEAQSDALIVRVFSTTDAAAYPNGPTRLPRTTLHQFELLKKGWKYRVLLTPIGSGIGFFAAVAAFFGSRGSARASAGMFGLWGLGTVGGYIAGNAADSHWRTVEIVP